MNTSDQTFKITDPLAEQAERYEARLAAANQIINDQCAAIAIAHAALKQILNYETTRDPNRGALFSGAIHAVQAAIIRIEGSPKGGVG